MVVEESMKTAAILGMDVGGTKTRWVLYKVTGGEVTHNMIADGRFSVAPLLRDVKFDIAALFRFASEMCARKNSRLSAVGVGFPKKFGDDYIIKPGYFSQQVRASPNNEYDGKNIYEILREAIPEPMPLTVINDGIAQLEGIVDKKLKKAGDLTALCGKTFGLIAPGTGLGGGFVEISAGGVMKGITDGHICDMMVSLPLDDIAFLKASNGEFSLGRYIQGNRVEAASVLSGAGLTRVLGIRGEHLEPKNLSDKQFVYIDIAARIMAQIVRDIRSRNVVKRDEDRQWSESDQIAASTTSMFFVSGGMGVGQIGEMILAQARDILRTTCPDVQLIKEQENMAPFGACLAANKAIRHVTDEARYG